MNASGEVAANKLARDPAARQVSAAVFLPPPKKNYTKPSDLHPSGLSQALLIIHGKFIHSMEVSFNQASLRRHVMKANRQKVKANKQGFGRSNIGIGPTGSYFYSFNSIQVF